MTIQSKFFCDKTKRLFLAPTDFIPDRFDGFSNSMEVCEVQDSYIDMLSPACIIQNLIAPRWLGKVSI